MTHTENLYQSILLTLGRISAEDLVEVNVLLKQFLQKKKTPKSDILEFSGIWKDDVDEDLFTELTIDLPNRRLKEDRTIV